LDSVARGTDSGSIDFLLEYYLLPSIATGSSGMSTGVVLFTSGSGGRLSEVLLFTTESEQRKPKIA